jgi:hypothetical protein
LHGIHRQETIEKGMKLRFEQNSHSDDGICAFRYWDFMGIGPLSGPSFNSILAKTIYPSENILHYKWSALKSYWSTHMRS